MDNATKALGANLAQSVGARRHPQDGAKAEPPPLLQHPGGGPSAPGCPSAPPGPQPPLPPSPGSMPRAAAGWRRPAAGCGARRLRRAVRPPGGARGTGPRGGLGAWGGGGERCPGTPPGGAGRAGTETPEKALIEAA